MTKWRIYNSVTKRWWKQTFYSWSNIPPYVKHSYSNFIIFENRGNGWERI